MLAALWGVGDVCRIAR